MAFNPSLQRDGVCSAVRDDGPESWWCGQESIRGHTDIPMTPSDLLRRRSGMRGLLCSASDCPLYLALVVSVKRFRAHPGLPRRNPARDDLSGLVRPVKGRTHRSDRTAVVVIGVDVRRRAEAGHFFRLAAPDLCGRTRCMVTLIERMPARKRPLASSSGPACAARVSASNAAAKVMRFTCLPFRSVWR